MAASTPPPNKSCYITLSNGGLLGALYTCGDAVQARVHLLPRDNESLSVSNLCVNFKCKARTLITTRNGENRRTHKCSVYLFSLSVEIIGSRGITVNSHQSWDVEVQFPWAVMSHPTQTSFEANSVFQHQAGHRLPPTWSQVCRGHTQSVQYYLESVVTRQGRLISHEDKDELPLRFCPPLEAPDPASYRVYGMTESIMRTSRLLDPAKRDEHYGLRERAKNVFATKQDPSAQFSVTASAPTVCCVGDTLSINLHIRYDQNSSTAPEQPEISIKSLYVRLNDFTQYRVPMTVIFGRNELDRDSDNKIEIARILVPGQSIVYEGMSLNEIAPLTLPPWLGPSFATFSISRKYILKISAVFCCVGKDYDLTIFRNALTVVPARTLHRTHPPTPLLAVPRLVLLPTRTQEEHANDAEEKLPPYIAESTQGRSVLPRYEEGATQRPPSSAGKT